jgi:geranylgeranyl diphosphate synthase type II
MKSSVDKVEIVLAQALELTGSSGCAPRLAAAMRWAVFPGGARIRPKLCMAVATACQGSQSLAAVPAAALELVHCASLVHDDLPCFDNAQVRRGRPSVQAEFGQRLAVLAGDALIVKSFEVLSDGLPDNAGLAMQLSKAIAEGVGTPAGIAAGQAWECEQEVDLNAYHRAKTGALFAAATKAGAIVAAVDEPSAWGMLGLKLGEAYQVADDILDAAGSENDMGKPVGQDSRLDRPNSVKSLGLAGAAQRLRTLVENAIESVPDCAGKSVLCERIKSETDSLLPARLANLAA